MTERAHHFVGDLNDVDFAALPTLVQRVEQREDELHVAQIVVEFDEKCRDVAACQHIVNFLQKCASSIGIQFLRCKKIIIKYLL